MNIDKKKLGNIKYSEGILEKLKQKYIGMKIKDIQYSYYGECFYLILTNGDKISFTEVGKN